MFSLGDRIRVTESTVTGRTFAIKVNFPTSAIASVYMDEKFAIKVEADTARGRKSYKFRQLGNAIEVYKALLPLVNARGRQ